MTWLDDLEKAEPEIYSQAIAPQDCSWYYDGSWPEETTARRLLEDYLDCTGYMWSISRVWSKNGQTHKIMIFIDPDNIIEIYGKSRIELLVSGYLQLKRHLEAKQ